jgi:hypothetical protein
MRSIRSLILAALLLAPVAMLQAGGHGSYTNDCCQVQCPQCDHTCKFSVDTDKEAKTCYDSTCEPVCIPKVVFPWQKKAACCNSCNGSCGGAKCCSVNNGACVRHVNVLKKYEYQCEVCKYKWEAVRGCGNNGVNGCGSCADGLGTRAAPADMTPTPADSELPPAPPAPAAAQAPGRGLLRYINF